MIDTDSSLAVVLVVVLPTDLAFVLKSFDQVDASVLLMSKTNFR